MLGPRFEHEVERRLGRAADRVKPPCVSTSRRRASPAWAPSAAPTSCESEACVQTSVETE